MTGNGKSNRPFPVIGTHITCLNDIFMNRSLILALAAAIGAVQASADINSPDASGYFQRGMAMYRAGNYAGCIDQLGQAVAFPADYSGIDREEAEFFIAMASLHRGGAGAIDALTGFLSAYPASVRRGEALVAVADYYYDLADWRRALGYYRQADAGSLNDAAAQTYRYHLAYCCLMTGDYDAAEPLYTVLGRDSRYAGNALFYRGYIAYARKDYDQALDLLSRVDRKPGEPSAMTDFYLSQIYYFKEDYGKAYSAASALLEMPGIESQYMAEAARVAGESAFSLGHISEAVALLRRYISLTGSPLPSAMYVLGLSQYNEGDYDDAIATLTTVSNEKNAMGQGAALLIGQCYLKTGNYSAASLALDRAYRMDYDAGVKETALFNYAVARMQGGKVPFGSSVAMFETFLRQYPSSRYAAEVQQYIVNGYMTDNNYDAALRSISAIRNPSDEILAAKQQITYTIGTRLLASGDTAGALTRFREARGLGNRNAGIARECDLWIGECLYKEGQYAEAAKSYEAYLKGSGQLNRALAYYDLGYARFGQKNFSGAYSDFDTFVKKPGDASQLMVADAYNRMADCLYYRSQFDRAATLYDRAFDTDPQAGDYALYQKAIMKGLRRQHREKIDGLADMMARFPGSALYPSALLETAEAWQELADTHKVISTYRTLVEKYPATAQGRQARLLLAITYLNNGNRKQAVSTYKEVVTLYPSSDEARIATEDLKNIYADDGNISEFAAFMRGVPDAPAIDNTELERLAFDSAERAFLKNGDTRRLETFVRENPQSADAPDALLYLARAAVKTDDTRGALDHATVIVDKYPHSDAAQEAYIIKAGAETGLGMTRAALETYRRLESVASGASSLNAARMGVMRSARDLDDYETSLAAADQLLASTALGAGERDEVAFTRASALSNLGRSDEAVDAWRELSGNLQELYGTKASVYLAQYYLDNGKTDEALAEAERLVEANPPHNYWLARGFIILSDVNRALGNTFEADEYLRSLRDNYPGSEPDIFTMIDQRLNSER